MLTTRIIAAAFGAATLLGAAMSSAPASAAPFSAGTAYGTGAPSDLIQQAWHRGRPHYGPHRPHQRVRCWTERRRVWTSRGWVVRNVRVCR
jgi:hypothetical protein